MKKVLFLTLTVLFFSCENDDLAFKIDESNDLYVFRGIEYSLEEGDSVTIIGTPAKLTPCDTVCFCFYPETLLPYILKPNESLSIPIPEGIENNEIKLSPECWKYSEERMTYVRNNPLTTEIPPYSQLTVTYTATFTGMVTGNVLKLKGKWKSESSAAHLSKK